VFPVSKTDGSFSVILSAQLKNMNKNTRIDAKTGILIPSNVVHEKKEKGGKKKNK
jgi:hypothetical protein